MNDQDIIRKAVELADGWDYYLEDIQDQGWLDALAAQLVRQVDAHSDPRNNWIEVESGTDGKNIETTVVVGNHPNYFNGPDRTMNTLKAIVESKVLE